MLALLALAAHAAPAEDPYDLVREWAVRSFAVDQIQGAPQGRAWDARRWPDGEEPVWDALIASVEPERGDDPVVVSRPLVGLSAGDLVPSRAQGDVEPGWLSPRLGADAWAGAGALEARAVVSTGLDVAPGLDPLLDVPEWRIGARSDGAFVALSQESRWFGPAREGALLYGDGARPLPAVTAGLDGRLPGRLDAAGRFSLQALVGVLPGERRDVTRPGWLIVDARWQPVPWIELGATRNALFGGREDGRARPVDVLQLLLPTDPHVEGDPDRALADTDERVTVDARVTVPLRARTPLDYAEIYVQHGGEDVIARRAGPVPVPSIAGSANVYGGEVAAAGYRLGLEASVIEDDLYRWYVGHRVYHDGWTVDGRSIGHPWGGDARTTSVWAGRVGTDLVIEARWTHVRRVLVADLVEDTLFVFPAAEEHDRFGLLVARPGERGGSIAVAVEAGPVRDEGFVPGADRFGWRLGLAWRPGWYASWPGSR